MYIYIYVKNVSIYIYIKINLYIIYCLVHVLSHHQPSDLTSGAETAPAKRKCVENIFICIHIIYIRVCVYIYIYVRTLSGYTYTHICSNKYVNMCIYMDCYKHITNIVFCSVYILFSRKSSDYPSIYI